MQRGEEVEELRALKLYSQDLIGMGSFEGKNLESEGQGSLLIKLLGASSEKILGSAGLEKEVKVRPTIHDTVAPRTDIPDTLILNHFRVLCREDVGYSKTWIFDNLTELPGGQVMKLVTDGWETELGHEMGKRVLECLTIKWAEILLFRCGMGGLNLTRGNADTMGHVCGELERKGDGGEKLKMEKNRNLVNDVVDTLASELGMRGRAGVVGRYGDMMMWYVLRELLLYVGCLIETCPKSVREMMANSIEQTRLDYMTPRALQSLGFLTASDIEIIRAVEVDILKRGASGISVEFPQGITSESVGWTCQLIECGMLNTTSEILANGHSGDTLSRKDRSVLLHNISYLIARIKRGHIVY
jgi:hypothetical protein